MSRHQHYFRARVRSYTLLAGLVLAACSGDRGPTSVEPAELPYPDLSRLDAGIREGLEGERATFDEALAAGNATAAEFGRIAMHYDANELYAPAEVGYRNALQLAPDELRWNYYLARLLETTGRRDEAVATYERVLELDPTHLPTVVQLGEFDLEKSDLQPAGERFARALEIQPLCVPAWVGAGNVALAERDYQVAVEKFERALEISPESNIAHHPLGLAYRGLGDMEQARHYLESRGNVIAAIKDPLLDELRQLQLGWRTHQDLGIRLAEAGRYEEALGAFEAAVAAAPDQVTAHVNMGSTLTHLGRHDDARETFEHALAIDPNNATASFNLGTLAARLGDDGAAIRYYEATLTNQPDYLEAHFNLANALRRAGRFAEAAEHYAAVVEGEPANALARLAEVLALVRLERYADALDRLEAAYAAMPYDRPIGNALARLLATAPVDVLRDGARAHQLAQDLFAEERALDHVVTMAMAAAELGDFATAVEWQKAAIGAADRAGLQEVLPGLRENLRLYESGRPCRQPWDPQGRELSP